MSVGGGERPVWIATISFVSTGVLSAIATGLLAITWAVEVPGTWSVRGFPIAIAITCVAIGVLVVVRVPGNPIGWLFVAAGVLSAIEGACDQYATLSLLAEPGVHPGGELAAWVAGWIWIPAIALVAVFLPLIFPDGRLLGPRWRSVVWLDIAVVAVATTGAAALPGPLDNAAYLSNPFAIDVGIQPTLRWLAYMPLILAIFIGASALALRFRRATGDSRQQLKWLAFSGAVCGLVFWVVPLGKLGTLPAGGAKVTEIVVTVGILGIPISAGVAVLRYRLWDIDRIVSRSIAYLVLTGLLLIVFGGMVVALQAVLAGFIQGDRLAVAASTLAAFALFQPLRRHVQGAVDRRFDRARVDAQQTIDGFAGQLRDEVDLEALRGALVATTDAAVRPEGVGIWVRNVSNNRSTRDSVTMFGRSGSRMRP